MLQQTDIEQLKSIPIVDFLEQRNVLPKKVGKNLLFSAPYRDDPNPSMKVDTATNKWYDFGTGEHGDIFDLVRKMNNTDFKGAVQALQRQAGLNLNVVKHTAPTPAQAPEQPGITVLEVIPLQHKALLEYVQSRNVDVDIAKKHCKQLRYIVDGHTYFGIGFKNDKGGYEIRNKYFKGATSKDLTIINKQTNTARDTDNCLVFEGFMDYLSYLTINKRNVPHGWVEGTNDSVVILNSLVNLPKAKPFIENQWSVNSFLDNDEAGRKATQEVRNMVKSGHPVWDSSICYTIYKNNLA